jgi:hypothetical protein
VLPRTRMLWVVIAVLCVGLLTAPALWNGFPLLQYDTGGYLARWFEGYLVPSRAAAYGLLLVAGAGGNFWPVLLIQCALTVWVLHLVLRAHGYGRPWLLLGVVITLTVATTLPWLSAILLTDIFCGLSVLALYLIMVRADALRRYERGALTALIAFAGATHSATYALLLGLFAGALIWHTRPRSPIKMKQLRDATFALSLGALLTFSANLLVSGQWSWTPGGAALSFGRMLQDGIVARYLDDHCPDPQLKLCAYRAALPRDADAFFWGNSIFIKLGRFAGLGQEMQSIALHSLVEYPGLQLKSAVVDSAEQLVDVHSGEGVLDSVWHTYAIIRKFTPRAAPSMQAAHQQKGKLSFGLINRLHYPLGLLALITLPAILLLRGERFASVRQLAATIAFAVLANAAICGVFSNPHDRYGARVVWLAGLTVLLAIITATRPPKFD